MLLLALLWAVLGLYGLLVPKRFMLFGSRWQLQNGDRAEPSDALVLSVRAGGVVLLIAAAGFTIWHFTSQTQQQNRDSVVEAWELGYDLDDIRVLEDPDVQRVTDVEASLAALDDERIGLPTWRTAVVGRDDIGDLGVTFADGDLLVAAIIGPCRPGSLMIHETDDDVTVAMVGITNGLVGNSNWLPCFVQSGLTRPPSIGSVLIVRVPLAEPLGDREVITVPAPHRDDVGLPPPVLPGVTTPPATPTPTPSP